jgi:spermidine synthase
MHEALARALPPGRAEALSREPVRVVFADPRRFLSAPGEYDLILVGSSETASGGSNRFFTEEFFRLCARRLSPGGVLALRLAASETAWGPRLAARNGGVHAALAAAFPDVFALPVGSELLMMGARGRLERDPATLRERLLARGVESRVVTPRRLEWLLADERVPEAARRLAESGAPANSDSRPAGYQQGVLLWIGMLLPSGEPSAGAVRRAGLLAAGLAAAALLAARFRAGFGRVAVAAAGGAGGMVAESVVLLRFQSGSGALYGEIGLLLTSFMAGLAAGAFAFDRFAGAGGGRSRRTGAALLGALALLEMGIAAAGATGVPAFGLAQSALWLSAAGALSASLFACASRMPTGGRGTGPFALYAADLAGGCAGSLVAGLLLVPLFGTGAVLSGTAFLALLAIACL